MRVSLPEGCDGDRLHSASGHGAVSGPAPGPRTERTSRPAGDRRPAAHAASASRYRSWVAQPGLVDLDHQAARRRATTGRACAAIWGPTASSQPANTPATVASGGGPPAARAGQRTASRLVAPRGDGIGVAHGTRSRARSLDACPRRRPRQHARSGRASSGGRRRRVVRTTWPAGQVAEQGARPGRGRARRTRRRAAARGGSPTRSVTDLVGGEAQRQRQRPLLALRRVGARRQAAEGEVESSRCGPTEVTRPAQVVVAGRGQGRGQPGAPPRRVVGQPRRRPARRPAARRPWPRSGVEVGRPGRPRSRPSASPASTSLASQTSSVQLDLGRRAGRRPASAGSLRWRRTRSSSRAEPVVAPAAAATSVSSRKRRRSAGPPFTSARSSGENTVTRSAPSRSRLRTSRWRLTCTRLRPPARRAPPRPAARARRRAPPRPAPRPLRRPRRTRASVGAPRKLSSVAR